MISQQRQIKTIHVELVEDFRSRWSWILWDDDGRPLAMSAITYTDITDAANELKYARKHLAAVPVVYYQNRPAGREKVQKTLKRLTPRNANNR